MRETNTELSRDVNLFWLATGIVDGSPQGVNPAQAAYGYAAFLLPMILFGAGLFARHFAR